MIKIRHCAFRYQENVNLYWYDFCCKVTVWNINLELFFNVSYGIIKKNLHVFKHNYTFSNFLKISGNPPLTPKTKLLGSKLRGGRGVLSHFKTSYLEIISTSAILEFITPSRSPEKLAHKNITAFKFYIITDAYSWSQSERKIGSRRDFILIISRKSVRIVFVRVRKILLVVMEPEHWEINRCAFFDCHICTWKGVIPVAFTIKKR